MVVMGMGSNKRILAWCAGLLVVGLLLASASAGGQYCEAICDNSKMYDACMRWCQLNGRLINQNHRQEAAAVDVQLGATTVAGVVPDCFKVCHNSKDHDACMSWCQRFGPRISKKHPQPQEAAAVQVQLGTTKAAKERQGGGGAADVLTQAVAAEARPVTREMTCSEFCVRNAWRFPGKYDGCMLVWCDAGSQVTKQINFNKHRTDAGVDGVSSFAK